LEWKLVCAFKVVRLKLIGGKSFLVKVPADHRYIFEGAIATFWDFYEGPLAVEPADMEELSEMVVDLEIVGESEEETPIILEE
jgi:hypothetical protein